MKTWSKEVFANNLKRYMDEKNITQKELAKIIGVSTTSLNEWVNAKKYPRIDKIEMLADYFGILKSDLIEDNPPDYVIGDDWIVEYRKKMSDKTWRRLKRYAEMLLDEQNEESDNHD